MPVSFAPGFDVGRPSPLDRDVFPGTNPEVLIGRDGDVVPDIDGGGKYVPARKSPNVPASLNQDLFVGRNEEDVLPGARRTPVIEVSRFGNTFEPPLDPNLFPSLARDPRIGRSHDIFPDPEKRAFDYTRVGIY